MTNPFETTYYLTTDSELKLAVKTLLNSISAKDNCLSLVFFGSSSSDNYIFDLEQIKSIADSQFDNQPLVSFIPQPLGCNGNYGLELTRYKPTCDTINFKQLHELRYVVFNSVFGKCLIIEGVNAGCINHNYTDQSAIIFNKISQIFQLEGFDIHHIVRQWNYIGNIVGFENGNQHYQLFNNARSLFYEQGTFTLGYPAATGISISINCLIVSLMAINQTTNTSVCAIDNALQTPAYNYSEKVLVNGATDKIKTTPKFERAKLIENTEYGIFFVSGTAAIRNEKSTNTNDAVQQTRETIETINYLIGNENLRLNNYNTKLNLTLTSIRVYAKCKEDIALIKIEVEKWWPLVHAIYLLAEVCRPELLVEIEGIAQ